jgi:hypothetical protein
MSMERGGILTRPLCRGLLLCALLAACSGPLDIEDPCGGHTGELVALIQLPPEVPPSWWVSLEVGESLQLTARVRPVVGGSTNVWGGGCNFEYGDPVLATFDWSSSADEVAAVDARGLVVARGPGTVEITALATSHGLQDRLGIWVMPR